MPSTKCVGLTYPTHFLKSRGSVIRNNFIEYITNQASLFAQQKDVYALFATNKAKHLLNKHFRAPVVTQIYSKSIKKNRKKSHF